MLKYDKFCWQNLRNAINFRAVAILLKKLAKPLFYCSTGKVQIFTL